MKTLLLVVFSVISLTAGYAQGGPPLTNENSDVYFGYYVEDAANNPEDPTPGALLLRLPKADAAFSGALYFTFVGCQTENWGRIEGRLEQGVLQGNWSGLVDDLPQNGSFRGRFDPQDSRYAGTYDNAQGKQFRQIGDCISYHIAARGTWEMFTPESLRQGNLSLTARWPNVEWESSVATFLLVYVLDKTLLDGADPQQAVVAQFVAMPGEDRQPLPTRKMKAGREYLVVGMAFDREMKPIGRGSVTVTKRGK